MKHKIPFEASIYGIILGTEKFSECVKFYNKLLGLPVWFEKEGLVCLRFGDGYLMIETGGIAISPKKNNSQNPTMIRFNVIDVEEAAANLRLSGVEVEVKKYDWGIVGKFYDPDGNACELKDSSDPFFKNN